MGQVSPELHSSTPPTAFLAIGDEALRLRDHPGYPWKLDLAEAWRGWTGLPFIFGLWVISRNAAKSGLIAGDPGEILRRGRDWGLANLDLILDLTGLSCPLSRQELKVYYEDGLVYHLGEMELEGLRLFYEKLADAGLIGHVPELRFWGDSQLLES